MTQSTIQLVTDERMREITTANLDEIKRLPYLYIPTDDPKVVRSWGIAFAANERGPGTTSETERLFPGTLVAPCFFGQYVDRDQLIYAGAEPAAAFGTGS